ncbi:MAG: 1,4-alpha-glucan branching protein GlgB [Candidatus Omnitrophica bacterium]|nr:1,4-alpha-glucan branching protein GlgB [Candidatus Omnitrophota bacterium]
MRVLETYPRFLSDGDIALFQGGNHACMQEKLGSHVIKRDGIEGVYFAVWAPSAEKVSVIGDFNQWDKEAHVLQARQDGSGIWEGFLEGLRKGCLYKYHVRSKYNGFRVDKADPYAFYGECPPKTSSIVYDAEYQWNDAAWLKQRKKADYTKQPLSVYEIHLGSFKRNGNGPEGFLTYRQMAEQIIPYVKDMGYTHVEFMPLMEHPFYGSWGYQTLGYFAPTARYGKPEDLMYLIDCFHQNGIGVFMDWVAAHFPNDGHGLVYFDGTQLYEHGALHPDWHSCVFNFRLNEIRSFLISSALYWVEQYHIDGLRVDAVASMLYLDYSRKNGGWQPNIYGGHENLEAIHFLRSLNQTVKSRHPDVQMIAEESSAWQNVSRPVEQGGLHFDMKWNMGWMHDTLRYICRDPLYRGHHDHEVAFCLYYAFSENFMLSLSHDEVVYGKGSLICKMPGYDSEKFSNLRALLGYMYGHPGKKLLFMGGEFGQWKEWGHESQLQWELLQYDPHRQLQEWVKDLNHLYRTEPALHERDFQSQGFEWRDIGQSHMAIFSFLRKGFDPKETVLVICNFGNITRTNYPVWSMDNGTWQEILNSDDARYGGKGIRENEKNRTVTDGSLTLTIPALSTVFLKRMNVGE